MEIIGSWGGRGQVTALNHQRKGWHVYCNGQQSQNNSHNSLIHPYGIGYVITVSLEVKIRTG